MRMVQFRALDGARKAGVVSEDGRALHVLRDTPRIYDLVLEADRRGVALARLACAA
jgi:hypothetical protein